MEYENGRIRPREVLGNHRGQSQEAQLELGLRFAVDSQGRTIWIVDAHRDDGKRFVVRADEKLTAFVEMEAAIQRLKAECGRRKRVGLCLMH
jgi:hypothetical protein